MPEHITLGFEVEPKGTTAPLFRQVHGNTVIPIDGETSRTAIRENPPEADGAYSLGQIRLHTFTADCIPLLFFTEDPAGPIAAVHAGWRGVMRSIAEQTRRLLRGWELSVWIGPHIRQCCFEVKADFVKAFADEGKTIEPFIEDRQGRLFCDLEGFLRQDQLKGLTLDRSQVRCTHCSTPPLPSFRRDGHTNVQIRSWIQKK